MKTLYDHNSRRISKMITRSYSTSFSMGIRLFHKRFRQPIYGIYGFVRLADEIVDTFHGYEQAIMLAEFTEQTRQAIDRKLSLNPVLNSFQEVVNNYNIEWELIERFLQSMEMDLHQNEHNQRSFEEYILGSAEVVGLMCLRVFTECDEKRYQELTYPAMRLGSAFQKINFLRDLKADHSDLGRSYFPGIELSHLNQQQKTEIEEDIAKDFKDGLEGIKKLPRGARFGVYLAYIFYIKLFKKIQRTRVEQLLEEDRIRIPNSRKISLVFSSYLNYRLNGL